MLRLVRAALGLVGAVILSIGVQAVAQSTEEYVYSQPEETGDGWSTGTLAEAGIDEALISRLIDMIRIGRYERIHGILIVKNGTLVLEEYFSGSIYYSPTSWSGQEIQFDRYQIHNLASLTKSVTSMLAGAAIGRGLIEDVDRTVGSFFPEYAGLFTDDKASMTIEHLLTMTSGWDWDENTQWVDENDMYQFNVAASPLRYLVEQDLVAEPGALWNYNGAAVTLLGKIIEKASGLNLEDFANELLFGPLGITNYRWPYMRSNLIGAHGDLKLRPRDVAKLGRLMLDDGVWDGVRLLPEGWVEASTTSSYAFHPFEGFYQFTDYGYLWWLMPYTIGDAEVASYTAAGWGGQRLIVIPEAATIVVFTGGNYAHDEPLDEIMVEYIVPALAE